MMVQTILNKLCASVFQRAVKDLVSHNQVRKKSLLFQKNRKKVIFMSLLRISLPMHSQEVSEGDLGSLQIWGVG